MKVNLTRAGSDTRQIVENMFTAYFYDLSQYDDHMQINAHGLPVWVWDAEEPQDGPRTHAECLRFNWWVRDSCELYVIRADGRPAGFVIICLAPAEHMPVGTDFELMDFYITPKYRRRGVGAQAARLAFDLHRGAWVVYQLERNAPARAFWQRVVAEYTGGRHENHQDGAEQRFRNDQKNS